ncbi:MAG: damage-inducible protein DinB [Proteobacteria bacterium]|nr:damage-inducible protein DinB [Pseudomonadota bacterium]
MKTADNTLQHLFQFKAWADDGLLTALAHLGSQSPITQLAIEALSHTCVVDQIFAAHLRRRSHAYSSVNLTQMPTLEALSADIRASDREYLEYVVKLDHNQLAERIDFAFTGGARGCMSRKEMLMHVITHGVGHRGQVSALMLLNSVAPPKDGFTTYLHEMAGRR